MYLHFGRILRPVWLMPLVRDVDKPQQALLDSVVTSEELLTVLGQLNVLKGFVHANIHQNGPSNYQSSEKQILAGHETTPGSHNGSVGLVESLV